MRLVLVPLKQELKSLVSVLNRVEKNPDGYKYKDLQLVVGGLGKLKFALSTYKYVLKYSPEKVYAVGSCGSLKDLKPLEVVQVQKVVEHDFRSSFVKTPEYINDSIEFEILKKVVCASGDMDVVTEEVKTGILERTSADIVTWESAGFFSAMSEFSVPYAEIRVVTDLANEGVVEDFKRNLSLGMKEVGDLFK